MKRGQFAYLWEILKAVGRIIAGIALLHFKTVFRMLRISLFLCLGAAAYRLVTGFRAYMAAGLLLIALGGVFILWTHEIVKRFPVEKRVLVTGGTFAVVRHPMYAGWCLTAAGAAFIAGYWPIVLLAAMQVLLMLSVSCAEDEENEEVFGACYRQYQKRVYLTGVLTGIIRLALRKRAFPGDGVSGGDRAGSQEGNLENN